MGCLLQPPGRLSCFEVRLRAPWSFIWDEVVNNGQTWDFPGGPVATILCSQGFNPWSWNYSPQATGKSLHATTEDPACHNQDWVSQINKYLKNNKGQPFLSFVEEVEKGGLQRGSAG